MQRFLPEEGLSFAPFRHLPADVEIGFDIYVMCYRDDVLGDINERLQDYIKTCVGLALLSRLRQTTVAFVNRGLLTDKEHMKEFERTMEMGNCVFNATEGELILNKRSYPEMTSYWEKEKLPKAFLNWKKRWSKADGDELLQYLLDKMGDMPDEIIPSFRKRLIQLNEIHHKLIAKCDCDRVKDLRVSIQ